MGGRLNPIRGIPHCWPLSRALGKWYPQNGRFVKEKHLLKWDDLGVPLFQETPISPVYPNYIPIKYRIQSPSIPIISPMISVPRVHRSFSPHSRAHSVVRWWITWQRFWDLAMENILGDFIVWCLKWGKPWIKLVRSQMAWSPMLTTYVSRILIHAPMSKRKNDGARPWFIDRFMTPFYGQTVPYFPCVEMPLMGAQPQLGPATFWYETTLKESENSTDDSCSW